MAIVAVTIAGHALFAAGALAEVDELEFATGALAGALGRQSGRRPSNLTNAELGCTLTLVLVRAVHLGALRVT